MYLQPYTNPRAGLHGSHRHHHSSSLNLATTRESRPSQSERINEESRSDQGSRRQSAVPERLPRAQSLDVLSETWLHSQTEQDTPTSHSTDSIFSSFSSSSEEREEGQDHTSEPDSPQTESPSRSSSPSSGSTQSTGSETASVAPKVPPRPKTQEILTRCSTMTRKAALANKTRLQVEEDTIHSRM